METMDKQVLKKTYKFRLYPNRGQATKLEDALSLCRWLYNAALKARKEARENHHSIGYYQQA